MCYQHLSNYAGLRIRPSNIPGGGMGLFVSSPIGFQPGDIVGLYTADLLSMRDFFRRHPPGNAGPYVFELEVPGSGRKVYLDARKTNSNEVRYANQCRAADKRAGYCRGNNLQAHERWLGNSPIVEYVVTKAVRPGDELFVSYGDRFWARG